jgi:LDH2 family malate/lactate/ureidoglycolate dehydrogenase
VEDLRTQGEILHPGEPELIAERERLRDGIPIDDEALADMVDWSRRLAVVPPTENP